MSNDNEQEIKQVIVMRKDLGMRKGKMIAQGAHASMGAIFNKGIVFMQKSLIGRLLRWYFRVNGYSFQLLPMDDQMHQWVAGRFKKITVSVNSEAELLEIYQKALDAGLNASLIRDAGLTEFGGQPTFTAVAVGPNRADVVNKITGNLPLL